MKIKNTILALGTASLMAGCANLHEIDDVSWCGTTEEINLAADALFRFDKYAEKDLLTQGRKTLDEVVVNITKGYAKVERIDLVGHTDRLGSEKYNYTLGLNRAKTVAAYFKTRGVNVPMTAKTAGETQPVTDGCQGVTPRVKLKHCLQPDRRVVVVITGVKKASGNYSKERSSAYDRKYYVKEYQSQ